MSGQDIAILILSLVVVIPAILVVTLRNIFHAALALGLSFFGVAGLYVILNAEFLAASQVLIYVGAVTVLILFAIMLTQRIIGGPTVIVSRYQAWGVLGALLVFLLLSWMLTSYSWEVSKVTSLSPPSYSQSNPVRVGKELLSAYLIPFELASFILLAAMVGAIAIAKEERPSE